MPSPRWQGQGRPGQVQVAQEEGDAEIALGDQAESGWNVHINEQARETGVTACARCSRPAALGLGGHGVPAPGDALSGAHGEEGAVLPHQVLLWAWPGPRAALWMPQALGPRAPRGSGPSRSCSRRHVTCRESAVSGQCLPGPNQGSRADRAVGGQETPRRQDGGEGGACDVPRGAVRGDLPVLPSVWVHLPPAKTPCHHSDPRQATALCAL